VKNADQQIEKWHKADCPDVQPLTLLLHIISLKEVNHDCNGNWKGYTAVVSGRFQQPYVLISFRSKFRNLLTRISNCWITTEDIPHFSLKKLRSFIP
jgi:hypothetical protein